MTSPLDDLDPVLTAPKRLAALAVLVHSAATSFGFLRDHLQISDSDLSKQMSALVDAGYATMNKQRGRGGSTTFTVTKAGRHAFDAHRRALERLVAGAESAH